MEEEEDLGQDREIETSDIHEYFSEIGVFSLKASHKKLLRTTLMKC